MLSDLMIDLETLNTTPDAAILTIGAVRFDPFGEELVDQSMQSFYVKVDLDSCDGIGLTISDDTLAWWGRQSADAQAEAFSDDNRVHINDAMSELHRFARGAKRVWSHGASFDTVICEHIFRKIQKAIPWDFWQVRCTRTLFDLGMSANRPPVLKHHALEDAWNQAVGVQNICRQLKSHGIDVFSRVT